jgi:predicted transcriptional regulator
MNRFDLVKIIQKENNDNFLNEEDLSRKTGISYQQLNIYLNNFNALGLLIRNDGHFSLTKYGKNIGKVSNSNF